MKWIKLGTALCLLLSLTGCWSKIELDEVTFIFGLFVDVGDQPNTVEVTIISPLPNRFQEQGGEGKKYASVSKSAHTITDAVMAIQKKLTRQMSFSHIKAVVISEKYAQRGISELLEWYERTPEFPIGTYIMACPTKAKELINLSPVFEQSPTEVLLGLASEDYFFKTTIKDCLYAEAASSGYIMNYLSVGEQEAAAKEEGDKWVGIQGGMLFHKYKMTGVIKGDLAQMIAWSLGNPQSLVYSLTWNNNQSAASTFLVKTKSSRSVKMSSNGPTFTLKLKSAASVDSLKNGQNETRAEVSPIILRKLDEKISSMMLEAITMTQQMKTDVFQLGMLLEWNYPEYWNKVRHKWDDYYSNELKIKVETQFNIANFGSKE